MPVLAGWVALHCASHVLAESKPIVFIDSAIEDCAILANAVLPNSEIVMLDPAGDELAQITATLAERRAAKVSAIHIVSHGSVAMLRLGSQRIDTATLRNHKSQFGQWRAALAPGARVLLYGCGVAADDRGRNFIEQLTDLTGADVAASSNDTGAASLGGDWRLECATVGTAAGESPFDLLQLARFTHLLSATLDNTGTMRLPAISAGNTNSPGTRVKDFIETAGTRLTVSGAGTSKGIAVTAVDNANGVWQYALNGSTWANFGSLAVSSARLLNADVNTRVRFVPNAGFSGVVTFSFKGWDSTGASEGATADVSSGSAYSSATASASLRVGAPYNPASSPSAETQFNVSTSGGVNTVSQVFQLANGNFVAIWRFTTDSANSWRLTLRGPDLALISETATASLSFAGNLPNLAPVALLGGGFAVVFADGSSGASNLDGNGDLGVRFQLYDDTGSLVGAATRVVNTITASAQFIPSAAPLANGGFIAGFIDQSNGANQQGRVRRFDAAGTALDATEISVHTIGSDAPNISNGAVGTPRCALLADGSISIAYVVNTVNLGQVLHMDPDGNFLDKAGGSAGQKQTAMSTDLSTGGFTVFNVPLSSGGCLVFFQNQNGGTAARSASYRLYDSTLNPGSIVNYEVVGNSNPYPGGATLFGGGFVLQRNLLPVVNTSYGVFDNTAGGPAASGLTTVVSTPNTNFFNSPVVFSTLNGGFGFKWHTGTSATTRNLYVKLYPQPAAAVSPPVITSSLTANGTYGAAISTYTVTGSNIPTSYGATGLPSGLIVNNANGQITGTPTTNGAFNVTISASNSGGTGSTTLVFTVAKKALTVTSLTAADKTYDRTTIASLNTGSAALGGVVLGDSASLNTVGATGAFSTKTVGGNKTVTVSGLTISGASSPNYTLIQPAITANITSATLTVIGITANDKPYDRLTTATLNTGSAVLTGVISGDAVTLNTGSTIGAFATRTVGGNKSVTISGLSIGGGDSGNYALTQPTATANITSAPLTVTGITANDKAYDGTTAAALNTGSAALAGMIAGDAVTLDTSGASGAFAGSAPGPDKIVTILGLTISGADSGNYSLTLPTTTAGITQAVATILLGNLGPIYDRTAKTVSVSTTPNGLPVSVTYDGFTNAPVDAGSYNVVGTVNDANYAGAATNTLVIAKAALTAAANDQVRYYSQPNPTFTGTLTGNIPDDNLSLAFSTPATSSSPVGSYNIFPSLNDPDSRLANYNVNLLDGTLTVTLGSPAIALATNSVFYTLGQSSALIAPQSAFSAPSSPLFNGGVLTVTIVSNLAPRDFLGVNTNALLSTTGDSVSYSGNRFAAWSGSTTGAGSLQFTLTSAASLTSIQELLNGLSFAVRRPPLSDPIPITNFTRLLRFDFSDGAGLTSSPVTLTVILNRAPVAGLDRIGTGTNLPATISFARLLKNDRDEDGDPLTIVRVDGASVQGGTLVSNATGMVYSPPAAFAGVDSFTYTLNDGRTGVSSGTVQIHVLVPGQIVIEEAPEEWNLVNNPASIGVMGLPGQTYRLIASEEFVTWTSIQVELAPPEGFMRFTDPDATNHVKRFYRTVTP